MRTFGLIGNPLTHSFSVKYFTDKFQKENITDAEYRNFPLRKIDDVALLFDDSKILGFNVTIPYKQTIIPFLDELDSSASDVRAVNNVLIKRSKLGAIEKKIGFNTDIFGFENSLKPFLNGQHKNALVLGSGGSSKAVVHVLNNLKIEFSFVSRNQGENTSTYDDLSPQTILEHTLIINTTPVGMFPSIHAVPDIPYSFITSKHLLFDLIYNPTETEFLKRGKQQNAQIKNGLEMLHLQAERSWEIWNDLT